MSFLYYFNDCPTCKNRNRNLVREVALHTESELDERYIFALPDVWGEAVKQIGAAVPFVYDTKTKLSLHVDVSCEDMREKLTNFFKGTSETPELV